MSITLGQFPKFSALAGSRPRVILVGGTGSGPRDLATTAYHAWEIPSQQNWTKSVWPDRDPAPPFAPSLAQIADWPGGIPIKWFGFPIRDPRRAGVRNTIDLALSALDDGALSIALVGFSHGGAVVIRALDEMLRIHAFEDVTFRLVTIATPPLRDTLHAARRVADSLRVRWFGVADRADSVLGTFAGILEHYVAGTQMSFGCEHGFRMLATEREGIPAHDGLPGSPECREAIRTWFAARAGDQT